VPVCPHLSHSRSLEVAEEKDEETLTLKSAKIIFIPHKYSRESVNIP